jgi:uncharacterized coiled-coil protein SlyX
MIGCEPSQQTQQQPLGDEGKPAKSAEATPPSQPQNAPQAQIAQDPTTPTTPAPLPLPIEPPKAPQRADIPQPAKTPVAPPELNKDVKDPATPYEYAVQSKDEFVASVEKRIKDLDQTITRVGEAIENLQPDAVAKKTIDTLREQRMQMGQKFDELKQASQDTWASLKTGFESTVKDLEKACEEAKSKYINN